MYSVVILGDVRMHSIVIEPDDDWMSQENCRKPPRRSEHLILGGCAMMENVIRDALRESESFSKIRTTIAGDWNGSTGSVSTFSNLALFGLERPASPEISFGELRTWKLTPHQIHDDKRKRPRLKLLGSDNAQNPSLPLSEPLRPIVYDRKRSFYERPEWTRTPVVEVSNWEAARKASCQSPDILVIDDLNQIVRQPFLEAGESDPPRYLSSDPQDPKLQIQVALQEIHRRFKQVTDPKHKKFIGPVMEPVIIGSIKGEPGNALRPAEDGKKTIWRHLLEHDRLRARTIILLDAEDLREARLPVSTGLSWERTAQDVLTQIRRSPEFRRFLDFGQVIVRFGATGALHIARRGSSSWSDTLHFVPNYHDATWTIPEQDGVLLGSTSIFAASLVIELIRNCQHEGGRPYIGNLPDVAEIAVSDAIRRCAWFHREEGYGKTCHDDFRKRFDREAYRESETLLPRDIFKPDFFNSSVRAFDSLGISITPTVTRADIPPGITSGSWSIVSQSTQTHVGEVAREIVLYGAKHILNQPTISTMDNAAAIARAIELSEKRLNELGVQKDGDWSKVEPSDVAATITETIATSHRRNLPQVFLDRSLEQIRTWLARHDEADSQEHWQKITALIGAWLKSKTRLTETADFAASANGVFRSPVGQQPFAAPFAEFGSSGNRLTIVDRREIEGFRAIEKLMRKHIEDVRNHRNLRPLCIAVFGPPGSGKSMAVKRINDSLNDAATKVLDAFNVAQFANINALSEAFRCIQDAASEGSGSKIPIAFFDEFDTRFPGDREPLGWLKFFLSPMEDGVFQGHPIRNAILVFAGGTSSTFTEFSLEDRSKSDQQWVDFSRAKGPDFVSRIRGHINIIGINPTGPDDETHLIRRAVVVRSMLVQMQRLAPGEKAKIDDNILRAVLHVPEYWHGARALRMLLELCTYHDGRISSSAVPPIQQINMLVDGQAFLDQLIGLSNPRGTRLTS